MVHMPSIDFDILILCVLSVKRNFVFISHSFCGVTLWGGGGGG